MVRNLLRNSGFERGDLAFWEAQSTIVIESTIKKRGSYSCKIVSDSELHYVIFYSKDYIPVVSGLLYTATAWVYNVDLSGIFLFLQLLDGDLNVIDTINLDASSIGTGAWEYLKGYVTIPDEVEYCQLYVFATGTTATKYGYIDSLSLQEIELERLSCKNEELIKVVTDTATHTVHGDEFFTGFWKHAEYFLDITKLQRVAAGGNVTIDVKIESYDQEIGTWRDAMVFQPLSTVTDAAVDTQEYKSLSSNLGWKQRVTYVTAGAGSILDCDLKVGVVYKR